MLCFPGKHLELNCTLDSQPGALSFTNVQEHAWAVPGLGGAGMAVAVSTEHCAVMQRHLHHSK